MPTKKNSQSQNLALKKRSVFMVSSLVAQYLLGMYINMFGATPDDPKFKTEPIFSKIAFALHSLLGLGLLIGSIVVLIFGLQSADKKLGNMTIYGFTSILLSFCAGIATVTFKSTASEISSYIMSAGFLASLLFYGKIIYYLKNAHKI